jgi:ribosomal protein S18 acetylase RimI-like enzyme
MADATRSGLDPDELLQLADSNLAEFARLQALWSPAGEVLACDDMQLAVSGTRFPAGMSNSLIPLGPPPDAQRAQRWVQRACAFFAERERGFTVYVRAERDRALAETCRALGMQAMDSVPGMVLDAPVPEAALAPGLRIARVRDVRGIADFVSVAAPAYAMMSMPEAVTQSVFAHPERMVAPDLVIYVAYLDGVPAATVLSLLARGIAGIYWVATRPDLQRRGLADAITRRAGNEAFARGAACVVLQASKFGQPVYVRMGYREITRYAWLFMTRAQAVSACGTVA